MAASFSLIIEDDAGKQIVVPFAKDVITIGRKEGNTIRLTERNVSRFHARLSKEASHVVVEDLTSFNGVKLNGDRIAGRVEVGAGDVIEIGDYHLELRTALTSATTQKMGPAGAKSAAIDHSHAEDDEFEGDTQRWDQPAGNAFPVAVGAMPTVEERVPTIGQGGAGFNNDGDTEKLDLDKLSSMVGAGQAAPPPAPLAPAQSWPPPPRTASPPAMSPTDMEATARQPVASMPLPPPPPPSAPPPPVLSAPSALTAPLLAAPAGDDDIDATQDMPLPAVVQARANLQAQGVGVRREPSPVEQTEQLRISPAISAIAEDLALPRLVVLNTIFSGSTFPLRAMENVLGRTDDNDIVLEHRSVSRNHAKLVREGERVRILDLKSANGVLVNGEEVEQHVLKSGDVIELGRVRIRFVPVGERFVVAPEEIERARIADVNGDGADDLPLVTANVGSGRSDIDAGAKKPVVLYAVLAVLVVMVLALGAIVLSRGDGDQQPVAPPTAVGAAEVVDDAVVVAAAGEPAATEPVVQDAPGEPATATATTTTTAPPARRDPKPDRVVEKEREKPKEAAAPPADNERQIEEARKALFSSAPSDQLRGVQLLEDLVRRNPREPRYLVSLAASYRQTKQPAKARATYEQYLQQWPTGSDAEKVRGILAAL